MASQSSPPLSSHYASQSGLAVAFARILRAHWPNLSRVEGYALVTQFAQASAVLAAQDYEERRAAAGVAGSFDVPLAAPPTAEQFSKTLNWVYGATTTVDALPDTVTPSAAERQRAADAAQAEEDRLVAAFTRMALQGGRTTIVEAVEADPDARAWARETRPDCCYFCALMATRGAVYRDEGAAGRDANARFTGAGEFKFHNNCHCVAVPVFGAFEKTAEARAWTRQYHDLRRDHGSVSLSMWRDHFESAATTNVPQTAGA